MDMLGECNRLARQTSGPRSTRARRVSRPRHCPNTIVSTTMMESHLSLLHISNTCLNNTEPLVECPEYLSVVPFLGDPWSVLVWLEEQLDRDIAHVLDALPVLEGPECSQEQLILSQGIIPMDRYTKVLP